MARIALQLHAVREDCERDFEGTLRAAEAGDTLAVATTVERPAHDDLAR